MIDCFMIDCVTYHLAKQKACFISNVRFEIKTNQSLIKIIV